MADWLIDIQGIGCLAIDYSRCSTGNFKTLYGENNNNIVSIDGGIVSVRADIPMASRFRFTISCAVRDPTDAFEAQNVGTDYIIVNIATCTYEDYFNNKD